MACARNIGLSDIPIVAVNISEYYEPFRAMLERSYQDQLIKLKPHEIVHFVSSAEEAVRWIEQEATKKKTAIPKIKRRQSALRKSSFMEPDIFRRSKSMSSSWHDGKLVGEDDDELEDSGFPWFPSWGLSWLAGLAIGVSVGLSLGTRGKIA
jgi:hypothetical protein